MSVIDTREVANTVYRLSKNYAARWGRFAHEDVDLMLHWWTWIQICGDPDLVHHTYNGFPYGEPRRLFAFTVLTTQDIPKDEVRFVLKPNHKLLDNLPEMPK